MTIQKLKELNKKNGGHFFDRETMKSNGDTMKSFQIRPDPNFPNDRILVCRKNGVGSTWYFDTKTGRVIPK